MQVINISKKQLNKNNYNNLLHWLEDPNHIYIGRNMNFYVEGANASKWQNPFTVKKYGLDDCLKLYEEYVRTNLYNDLDELKGKIMGCWCIPNKCHGDILIKLFNEKNSNK